MEMPTLEVVMDPRGMTVVRDFLTAEFDDQERKRIRGAGGLQSKCRELEGG